MSTATNSHELKQALLSASATGGVISLAPGTYSLALDARYGDPWSRFEKPITITSTDPDKPATFTSVKLFGSSNLSFKNVDFQYNGPKNVTAEAIVTLDAVSNVTIRDARFTGALGENFSAIADGYPIGAGVVARHSSAVTIADSDFTTFFRAATFDYTNNIRLIGNDVTKMRSDGFVLSAVRDVLIEGNHLYDFRKSPASPDHQDMIQLFSSGRNVSSRDIVIRDNLLQSGFDYATQTIFMRNEAYDRSELPTKDAIYRNITIEDNVIYNGHQWGIYVGQTDGLNIRNNTLLHNATGGANPPVISIKPQSTNVTVVDNIVPKVDNYQASWKLSNNIAAQQTDYFGYNYYGDLFVNALAGGLLTEEELRLLPGAGVSAGAARSAFDSTPDALTALFTAEVVSAVSSLYRFDARLTADQTGFVAPSDAEFVWTFADGARKTGAVVEHRFEEPGRYGVTLEVVTNDGRRDALATQVRVIDPSILHLVERNGRITDISSYQVGFKVDHGPVAFVEGRGEGDAFVLGDGLRLTVLHGAIPRAFSLPEMSMSFGFKARNGVPSDDGTLMNLLESYNAYLDSSGELTFTLYTNAGRYDLKTRGADLLDGAWHDVTVVYDDAIDRLAIYVDDALAGSTFATGVTSYRTSKSLYLGDTWKPSAEVAMDRFEIWNYALAADDVAELHSIGAPEPDTALESDGPADQETPPDETPPDETPPDETSGDASAVGEVGVIAALDHNAIRVAFTEALDAPVVFAQVNTFNGVQAVVARVTDVTATGFTIALEEPDSYDQYHAPESVSWLAVEAGEWRLADGSVLKAGAVASDARAAGTPVEIAFGDGFADAPAVLTQMQTREAEHFAYTRQLETTTDRSVVIIERAEAFQNAPSLPETIGWMAMERGPGAWSAGDDAFLFNAGHVSGVDHQFRELSFGMDFAEAPAFFGAVASRDGADPTSLRGAGVSSSGAVVALEEDVTLDSETWHVPETAHWLAIGGAGLLYADAA